MAAMRLLESFASQSKNKLIKHTQRKSCIEIFNFIK